MLIKLLAGNGNGLKFTLFLWLFISYCGKCNCYKLYFILSRYLRSFHIICLINTNNHQTDFSLANVCFIWDWNLENVQNVRHYRQEICYILLWFCMEFSTRHSTDSHFIEMFAHINEFKTNFSANCIRLSKAHRLLLSFPHLERKEDPHWRRCNKKKEKKNRNWKSFYLIWKSLYHSFHSIFLTTVFVHLHALYSLA